MFFQPEDFVQCLFLVFPSLVCVDGDRQVSDFAYGCDHFPVTRCSDFYFQYVELPGDFLGFKFNHFFVVYAYRICGVGRFGRVQSQHFIPRSSYHFAYEVVQGYVYGCFGCRVARREAVHVSQDVVYAEWVAELSEVHFFQEVAYAIHCLSKVWRHGGFTISGESVVVYSYLNVGGSASGE